MSHKNANSGRGGRRLSLLALTPIMVAMMAGSLPTAEAAARITAKAVFKNSNLSYSGKIKGAPIGTEVSLYDAESGILLHSMPTDPKNSFKYSIPMDTPICNVKISAGGAMSNLKVTGAPKANCKTSMICDLKAASSISASANQPVTLNGSVLFSGKTKPKMTFTFGDGKTDENPASNKVKGGLRASSSHQFTQADSYAIKFSASLGEKRCEDSLVMSVAPQINQHPVKVSEAFGRPSNASGMNGEYSVIPFSDRGDVGTANVAPNQYQQTQALNAIVYKKDPKKPQELTLGDSQVTYSAASNPNDPVGSDSINSTSQNLFADGSKGANYDKSAPGALERNQIVNPTTGVATKQTYPNAGGTQLIEGKNVTDIGPSGVSKSGLWDRIRNRDNSGGSDMTRLTSNPADLLTDLDEGARASKDLMTNTQSMPGRSNPYAANVPQPFNAYDDQGFFTAQMLPIVGVDDFGRKNPFPLMRVEAKNVATDGAVISSTELSCAECHSKGNRSADDNVWYTPVGLNDPEAKGDGSALGTNSGSSYPPGRDKHGDTRPPAIQNRFELKVANTDTEGKNVYQMVNPFNTAAANLRTDNQEALYQPIAVLKDGAPYVSEASGQAMYLRGDRVKAYQFSPEGKLQIQLKFKAPDNETPQAREQAAMFNWSLLHDYYDSFGNTEPAANAARAFSTQFADALEDKTAAKVTTPPSCGGHHFSTSTHEVGRSSTYDARFVYSNYSRTMHAFHGRMQVYSTAVSAQESADGLAHAAGDLVRDKRGHHIPFGGAGWDPEKKNNYKIHGPGSYDGTHDDFDPATFPMLPKAELMLPFDLKRKANGDMVATGLKANVGKTDMVENCSVCHAGKTDKVYHDIHFNTGLTCESCHGDMQAVGALWLRPGKNFTDHKKHNFRKFEYDQPDCGSCHFGSTDKVERLAFAAWDKSATTLKVGKNADGSNNIDQRFAVQPTDVTIKRIAPRASDKLCLGTDNDDGMHQEGECQDTLLGNSANGELTEIVGSALFRKSLDTHGSVPCAACHGPAHTIWPVRNKNANANVTAKQLQGYEGTLMECDVCHSKQPDGKNSFADGNLANDKPIAYGQRGTIVNVSAATAYLAGPHGMHPVNDEWWWKSADGVAVDDFKNKTINGVVLNGGWHSDITYKKGPNGEDQCAACHGANHKGTRLSRTLIDRNFMKDNGKKIKVKAGTQIGCDLCHSMNKSFKRAPAPKAKDGGWPKPTVTALPVNPVETPHDHSDVDTAADPGAPASGGGGGH